LGIDVRIIPIYLDCLITCLADYIYECIYTQTLPTLCTGIYVIPYYIIGIPNFVVFRNTLNMFFYLSTYLYYVMPNVKAKSRKLNQNFMNN
jgi:hypothetical protein